MKTVYELNKEELDELRSSYIEELNIDHDNVSDEEVRNYYSGTNFVEEDFFCNLNNVNNSAIKVKLLEHIKKDEDFSNFLHFVDEAIENLELENYYLDKKYIDISYVIIENKIINLDEVYSFFKNYFN